MDFFSATLLGVIQGLTEFLPVSSSGHLVLVQKLLPNFSQPGVTFDVFLHLGTLLAVFIYFRRKIWQIIFDSAYIKLLFVGSLPAFIIGFAFRDLLEDSFSVGGIFLALQFLITAIFCFLTDYKKGSKTKITTRDSLWIGLAQAFAILPAISRSGATIFTGATLGINKKEAATYSFILSVPAIIGANALELISHRATIFPLPAPYLIGLFASLLTGMVSIYLTIKLLDRRLFRVFGVYALVIAFIALFI